MYDAEIRDTYATLYKTAAAGFAPNISKTLKGAVREHPLVLAAITAATAGLGGHALGASSQAKLDEAKVKAWMGGLNYGRAYYGGAA